MRNVWIVITTVNKPTRAILQYSEVAARMGWRLLIVGDLKTPDAYRAVDCIFLPVEEQQRVFDNFSEIVPFNHYCRKNIGYLYAMENGAEWIFDTDDDNLPLENFAENITARKRALSVAFDGFVNVYRYFSEDLVWPRGLPLVAIRQRGISGAIQDRDFPVQQFLADKDPDVDAIYRLVIDREVRFRREAQAIYLTPGTWSPFNSQATLFHREQFRTLYLPCFVPFRMTDIWRSFVAQKLLWASGAGIAFLPPIVVQERNVHDYFADFRDEILGYVHNQEISIILSKEIDAQDSSAELMERCYAAMWRMGVLQERELVVIKMWNSRLNALGVA